METEGPDKFPKRKESGKSQKIGCHHSEHYKKKKKKKPEGREHFEGRKAI